MNFSFNMQDPPLITETNIYEQLLEDKVYKAHLISRDTLALFENKQLNENLCSLKDIIK